MDGTVARYRFLSIEGPVVLFASVLIWVAMLWTGWVLCFSAAPESVRDPHTSALASFSDRIYFIGSSLFTLGNGDFTPRGARWQIATTVVSLTGFGLITLTVTYVLSVLEAVVKKRSFASQVFALGERPEEFVIRSWDAPAQPASGSRCADRVGRSIPGCRARG